ncbi:MAG TPA: PTS sugar transporter subunit IIB [Erysipelotrichaceae bacterium]|nr:PTS sugar transporter subunit IIB [Erysipelotrichaceae bacterium]HQB33016.1 PTS sugar transporter subunit IIB [Erysipelotrichaceae bacterium]
MKPKIQAVCGFGVGSSMMLKMNIEKIAKEHGYDVHVFCGDVATSTANQCDVIFTSKDLGNRIVQRATVPVIILNNFMDKKEIEEKVLAYLETL